jgi:hypothetical protein
VCLPASEQVVRVVELETADPARQGGMTFPITLRDADGGVIGPQGLPRGVARAGNELGGRMALDKLAALVEVPRSQPRP